jgi:hypothetical protein
VGDTPYFINENNMDHYPLLNPVDVNEVPDGRMIEPSPTGTPPANSTSPEQQDADFAEERFPVEFTIAVIALAAFVGIAATSAFLFLKSKKPNTKE